MQHSTCRALNSNFYKAIREATLHDHKLVAFDQSCSGVGQQLIACKACGSYATKQFRGLHRSCVGAVRGRRTNSWKRLFAHGRNPSSGRRLGEFGPFFLPEIWDPELCDFGYCVSGAVGLKEARHHGMDDPEGDPFSDSD